MQLEEYFDTISPDEIRLKGHRINIEHIVERYQDGMTPQQIMSDLPSLSLEEVFGALTYYLHNQAEVDEYLARLHDYVEEQVRLANANPSPVVERIRARMREKQRA
jgi:uncharacterized protein (DUF433 family)